MSEFTSPPDVGTAPSAALPDLATAAAAVKVEGEEIPAAVLVPLFLRPDSSTPHVVLTKRRADLRRHAGEISFPGGRKDDEDTDLTTTALREAEEEIGLPRTQATLLGTLPPVSTFATRYVIHPVVAQIPPGLAWRLSAKEVDTILELPLTDIQAGAQRIPIERRGISFETDAYVVAEHTIWGATARILAHLFDRLSPHTDSGIALTPAPANTP